MATFRRGRGAAVLGGPKTRRLIRRSSPPVMLSRLLAARQVTLGNQTGGHVGAEISDSVPTKSRWVLSCLFVYIRPFTLILYEELNMSVCVCVS